MKSFLITSPLKFPIPYLRTKKIQVLNTWPWLTIKLELLGVFLCLFILYSIVYFKLSGTILLTVNCGRFHCTCLFTVLRQLLVVNACCLACLSVCLSRTMSLVFWRYRSSWRDTRSCPVWRPMTSTTTTFFSVSIQSLSQFTPPVYMLGQKSRSVLKWHKFGIMDFTWNI